MSKDNVTSGDALDNKKEDNPEKIVVLPNPRNAVFDHIQNRRALELKQNMIDNDIDPAEIEAQMEGVKDATESVTDDEDKGSFRQALGDPAVPTAPPAKPAEPAKPPIETTPTAPTYKIVVDGVEMTLTQEQLEKKLAEIQKAESVDRRFEKVAEERKKLEADRAAFTAEQEETVKKLDKLVGDAEVTLDPDKVRKVVHLIREGEGDDAEKALEELIATSVKVKAPKALTEAEVESMLAKRESKRAKEQEEQAEKDRQEALTKAVKDAERDFEEHFKDQIGDKSNSEFYDLAIVKYQKIAKDPEWNTKSYAEQFIYAGDLAAKQLGMSSPAKTKDQLKEDIVSTPTASVKSSPLTEEEHAQTRSDVIADMKRQRNQL